jgi:hypothetical protein
MVICKMSFWCQREDARGRVVSTSDYTPFLRKWLRTSDLHEGREGGGPEEGRCRAGLLTVVDLIFGLPGITDCDGLGR